MIYFQEAQVENLILKHLSQALNFTMKRAEIISNTGLTVYQVKNALYRMKLKGLVVNEKIGYWRLLKVWRKIRHLKRVVETTNSHPISGREFDCDVEMTSEGYVPVIGVPNALPPQRPSDTNTIAYGKVLNPKLVMEGLDVLGRQGQIFLSPDLTNLETTCTPKMVRAPEFCIDGTEWLEDVSGEPSTKHIVEVVFLNPEYPQKIYSWYGAFDVSEEEFAHIIKINRRKRGART